MLGHWVRTSSLPRYLLIGGSAFLLDFGLLNLGVKLGLTVLIANTISTAIAIIYSFIAHRFFTFKTVTTSYKLPAHWQALTFVMVSLAAIGLSDLIVHFLTAQIHYSPSRAKIIASAILFVWNYVVNRAITFRGKVSS